MLHLTVTDMQPRTYPSCFGVLSDIAFRDGLTNDKYQEFRERKMSERRNGLKLQGPED
jgi:hypothetical protein